MEEAGKGCLMIRMDVSGRMFLLVLVYPCSPPQRAVVCVCVCVCVCARGKTVLVTPSAELTVGGHAAVETFPEAARLAAVATVTPDGTVAGVLTRVRAATQTLLILHRTPEETLKTHVVKNVFIPAIISSY